MQNILYQKLLTFQQIKATMYVCKIILLLHATMYTHNSFTTPLEFINWFELFNKGYQQK